MRGAKKLPPSEDGASARHRAPHHRRADTPSSGTSSGVLSGAPSGKTASAGALAVLRAVMPWIVLAVTLLGGIGYMAVTAPGHIPDVWSHVYRVDGILNGDVLARPVQAMSRLRGGDGSGNVGGRVDWQWIEYSETHYDGYDSNAVLVDTITASDDAGADVPYNNTATNTPAVYLPQLTGFAVGKALGLDAGITYHLAEAIMLVVYAACTAGAVALLPRWRILVGLVMLCPLVTHRYSFAISADSLTQALAFLLSCMVFRTMYRRVGKGYCAALAGVCLMLAMCKLTYAPLMLLALAVPWLQRDVGVSPFGASPSGASPSAAVPVWRDPRLWIGVAGNAVSAAWLMFWMSVTGWFVTTPMLVPYEEMIARRHALLADPATMIAVVKAIALSIVTGRSNMGNRPDSVVIRCCWIAIAGMAIVLAAATARRVLRPVHAAFWWFAAVLIVGIMLLTYLALWLQYTPTESPMIDGMQHRYFLPLAVLGVLCGAEAVSALRRPAMPQRSPAPAR